METDKAEGVSAAGSAALARTAGRVKSLVADVGDQGGKALAETAGRLKGLAFPRSGQDHVIPGEVYVDHEDDAEKADRAAVERERDELRQFVSGLSIAEIRSGGWFSQLLRHAFMTYTEKVDWRYFQEKYEGVPADVIVDQRIKMAARYAAVEGGLSASAYTGAVVATIGSAGGGSPVTVPAAVATVMIDVVYLSQLQIRLAYDIAVLYRIPLDLSDPDDLWKLIRVAFTIKGGETITGGILKWVPAAVRPLVKKFFSGPVLQAAKGLPVVGKFLLQRNLIKIGIPLVGVPLAVLLNRYTTVVAGRHAQAIFRNEARVIEVAETLTERTRHPELLLWVAWLVVQEEGKVSDDEALLMRHLVRLVRECHGVVDDRLARLVDIDPDEVWRRIDDEPGDLSDIASAASRVAAVDGDANARERATVTEIHERCRRE